MKRILELRSSMSREMPLTRRVIQHDSILDEIREFPCDPTLGTKLVSYLYSFLQPRMSMRQTFTTPQGLTVTLDASTQAARLQMSRVYAYVQNDAGVFPANAPADREPTFEPVKAGWHLVESTAFSAIKWEPEKSRRSAVTDRTVVVGNLVVEFKDDRSRHRYIGLTEAIVRRLLDAPSKGRYFEGNIKRQFRSTKID